MAGEILGMDGIGTESIPAIPSRWKTVKFAVIPFAQLEHLSGKCRRSASFSQSDEPEIVRDHGVMMLLGPCAPRTAGRLPAQPIAALTARGYSPQEFHLRMTREEIALLGLKLETVSRAFSRFQDEGLISVHQKHIRILDSGLKRLLNHQPV